MTKRVAVLGFMLESNRFSPVTTEADYRKRCYLQGAEITTELKRTSPGCHPRLSVFATR
jgi:microcystin degradation protein MlrC